jgi:hypothetical protein
VNGAVLVSIACALAGLAAGAWGGFRLGVRYGSPPWRYWAMNAGALAVCLGACAVALAVGARWFAVLALGALAGLLTGMKYGIRGGFVMHPGAAQPPDDEADDDADGDAVDADGALFNDAAELAENA